MNKEQIFTNPDEINKLPSNDESQAITITPDEILDYFTNNKTEEITPKEKTVYGAIKDPEGKDTINLTVPREEWIAAGLDEEVIQKEINATDPAKSVPIPDLMDTTISNAYVNNLLHSPVTASAQEKLLYDLTKVTIDDTEKEWYLRCVLENEQFDLYVTIGNKHKIGFKCKSKTIETQNLITLLADNYINERDETDNSKYKHNTFESGMYILKLNAMFCLDGEGDENGCKKPSMFIPIPLDAPFETQKELVQQNIAIIDKLSFAKWNAMLNIIRIFEQKEVLLGAEMISGGF